MVWQQIYDPIGNTMFCTLPTASPVGILLMNL